MSWSFEFFPPKTDEGLIHLLETAKQLNHFGAEYFSVTHGAGGSTQNFTVDTIAALQKKGYDVAPHLSCIGASKQSVQALLHHYQAKGVKRIVALRGDLPSGFGSGLADFQHASDLVTFIRQETGNHFHIKVAAYPESHPQAPNIMQDLRYFKEKVSAGANSAITQYFYHPEAYCQFVEDCQALGVTLPIVPGIMPIYNFSQLCRFSDMCGAEIPRYIRKRIEAFSDDTASIQAFGIEIVTKLCQDLLKAGAPGLHFYTLNKHQIITQVLKHLSI
jgi:methylenetetrahydrofolate reductase (NADPH)